jgi:hypothetical protein
MVKMIGIERIVTQSLVLLDQLRGVKSSKVYAVTDEIIEQLFGKQAVHLFYPTYSPEDDTPKGVAARMRRYASDL